MEEGKTERTQENIRKKKKERKKQRKKKKHKQLHIVRDIYRIFHKAILRNYLCRQYSQEPCTDVFFCECLFLNM